MSERFRIQAPDAGFGLIEAILAAALVATLAAGAAQVFALSARARDVARIQTLGALLAAQKMEQLRSLTFAHDRSGAPRSDEVTNLGSAPPGTDGAGLQRAPDGSLERDVPAYVDYLGPGGARVGGRSAAAYVRRWAVQPFDADPDNLLVLQVRVVTVTGGDTRLVSLRARRP